MRRCRLGGWLLEIAKIPEAIRGPAIEAVELPARRQGLRSWPVESAEIVESTGSRACVCACARAHAAKPIGRQGRSCNGCRLFAQETANGRWRRRQGGARSRRRSSVEASKAAIRVVECAQPSEGPSHWQPATQPAAWHVRARCWRCGHGRRSAQRRSIESAKVVRSQAATWQAHCSHGRCACRSCIEPAEIVYGQAASWHPGRCSGRRGGGGRCIESADVSRRQGAAHSWLRRGSHAKPAKVVGRKTAGGDAKGCSGLRNGKHGRGRGRRIESAELVRAQSNACLWLGTRRSGAKVAKAVSSTRLLKRMRGSTWHRRIESAKVVCTQAATWQAHCSHGCCARRSCIEPAEIVCGKAASWHPGGCSGRRGGGGRRIESAKVIRRQGTAHSWLRRGSHAEPAKVVGRKTAGGDAKGCSGLRKGRHGRGRGRRIESAEIVRRQTATWHAHCSHGRRCGCARRSCIEPAEIVCGQAAGWQPGRCSGRRGGGGRRIESAKVIRRQGAAHSWLRRGSHAKPAKVVGRKTAGGDAKGCSGLRKGRHGRGRGRRIESTKVVLREGARRH
jgi:hypothetical protein